MKRSGGNDIAAIAKLVIWAREEQTKDLLKRFGVERSNPIPISTQLSAKGLAAYNLVTEEFEKFCICDAATDEVLGYFTYNRKFDINDFGSTPIIDKAVGPVIILKSRK